VSHPEFPGGHYLYFTLDALQQIADIFECQQFFLVEPDIESALNSHDQVNVRQGVPAVDVIGGHFRSYLDGIVVEDCLKDGIELFLGGHVCSLSWFAVAILIVVIA
jgi:hypothetical protein